MASVNIHTHHHYHHYYYTIKKKDRNAQMVNVLLIAFEIFLYA